MRLFSEKVKPTFTSSNLNILTVKDFQEIFFDVFEFEINGKKFIAEKTSEYKGFPVIEIPLVLEGKKLTAPFVLQQGEFEVLFNENNSTFVELESNKEEILFEEPSIDSENEIEGIIFEKKEDILKEINSARQSAVRYIEKLKLEKLNEAHKEIEENKNFFKQEIDTSKKELLEEFLKLVNTTKSDLISESDQYKNSLVQFVENKIESISEQLIRDIDSKQVEAENKFSDQINELATNVISNVILKELDTKAASITESVNTKFKAISSNVKDIINEQVNLLEKNISLEIAENNDAISNLQKANIELNDRINKDTNKALSRIGNIKTQLDESIKVAKEDIVNLIDNTSDKLVDDLTTKFSQADESIVESVIQKIVKAEEKISKFYESKISTVRQELENTTEQNRSDILRLIDESKQSILSEISNIKVDVPNIVIEKTNGNQTVDLKGIKSELEKVIGTRFSNELQSLRRFIEMSSGGGSVAKQFASGGTMDGNLTVVGAISASQYLGITVPSGEYLPLSGGTVDGSVTITGGLSADRMYTTQLDALSANITVIDIKQYELSGFNVQGNCTIQGNVSASGSLSANNLVYKGGNADNTSLLIGTNDGQPLNFETNGTTRMFVTSSGEFGFGTGLTTIQAGFKFEVVGLAKFSNDLYAGTNFRMFGSTPAIFASDLKINNTSSALIMMLSSNGNVGIGTATPNEKLTVAGNISATGTSNTLPNQTFTNSSSILTKSYLDSRNSFTSNTQQTRLTADTDFQFGVVEYFNDFLEIPSTAPGSTLYFATVSGSGGSMGHAFGDQSSVDVMINLPIGNDNFTSRGIIQPQVQTAVNSAIVFAPFISIGQNRAQYYTQSVAWRVMFAQNDLTTYYRFGVQPPMGGSSGASFTAQQRSLCFDGAVSPNFFFNAPNLRTYNTSFSADTGIPCLTGMWCNIHMDIYPNTTTYNTISVIDLTVNYTLSGLRYTYRFTPSDGSTVAASTGWWKQQATGVVIGQQDSRGTIAARKAMLVDWIYVKTAPLSAFTGLPSNWNSTRFLK